VLEEHGDLYREHVGGFPTLDIREGVLELESVVGAPFGTGSLLSMKGFASLDEWVAEQGG
jgi:hypothetical protein